MENVWKHLIKPTTIWAFLFLLYTIINLVFKINEQNFYLNQGILIVFLISAIVILVYRPKSNQK